MEDTFDRRCDIIDSVFEITMVHDYNRALFDAMVRALKYCGKEVKAGKVDYHNVAQLCIELFENTPLEDLDIMCAWLEKEFWDTGYDSY